MKKNNLWKIFIFIFIGLFIVGLSGYAIKGTYFRYAQDDYCYANKVTSMGFWKAQIYSYFNLSEYHPDRFSLTFFQDLIEVFGGSKFVPYVATIVLIVWIFALAIAVLKWLEITSSKKSRTTALLMAFLIALFTIFFTLYLHPHRYQILLWTSGMNTYLMPTIFATAILAFLLSLAQSGNFRIYHAVGLGILSFLAGGFSETTSVWQLALWSILFILIWFNKDKNPAAKNAIKPLGIIITLTIASTIILAICPTLSEWSKSLSLIRPDIKSLVFLTLTYAADYIRYTFTGFPLPFMIIAAFGFWVNWISEPDNAQKPVEIMKRLILIIMVSYALSVADILPSVMAMSLYPSERALTPAYFTLVICVFLIGWEVASLVSGRLSRFSATNSSLITASLLGLVLLVYTARAIPRAYSSMAIYRARAMAWDARQKSILKSKASGEEHILVPAFDSIKPVIVDLHPEETYWVNICAAKYYGVEGISAIDGYNGSPTYIINNP